MLQAQKAGVFTMWLLRNYIIFIFSIRKKRKLLWPVYSNSLLSLNLRRNIRNVGEKRRSSRLHRHPARFKISCMFTGELDTDNPEPVEVQGMVNGTLQFDSPRAKVQKLIARVDSVAILGKVSASLTMNKNTDVSSIGCANTTDVDRPGQSELETPGTLRLSGDVKNAAADDTLSIGVSGEFESEFSISGDHDAIQVGDGKGESVTVLRGKLTGILYYGKKAIPLDIVVTRPDKMQ